jgi:hypothetical protein
VVCEHSPFDGILTYMLEGDRAGPMGLGDALRDRLDPRLRGTYAGGAGDHAERDPRVAPGDSPTTNHEREVSMSAPTTAGTKLPARTIRTINSARDSKGSIHDDEKAREMGYQGGFVGGVTVLGYMMRLMHENFGVAWLATGRFNGRLRQPTYADVDVTVEGTVVEEPSAANGGRVMVELRVLDTGGSVTAFASASCEVGSDG